MKRIAVVSLLVLGLLVAGCGGSSSDSVSGEQAKTTIEKALNVKLKAEKTNEKGMKASYVAQGGNSYVAVGVFDDADKAESAVKQAKDQAKKTPVKILSNKNVVVVYASLDGKDNPKLQKALDSL